MRVRLLVAVGTGLVSWMCSPGAAQRAVATMTEDIGSPAVGEQALTAILDDGRPSLGTLYSDLHMGPISGRVLHVE